MFLAVLLFANDLPKVTGLHEIIVRKFRSKGRHFSVPVLLKRYLNSFALRDGTKLGEDVVRIATVVSIHSSGTVSHIRCVDFISWPVWWQLEVVWSNAVAVSVRIAEHSRLQNYMPMFISNNNIY